MQRKHYKVIAEIISHLDSDVRERIMNAFIHDFEKLYSNFNSSKFEEYINKNARN